MESQIKNRISSFQKRQRIASISFSLFKGGTYRFDYATGYADINKKIKATPNHIYPLASITKPITASAFLRLVEKQKVNLDDSAYHFIKDFPKDVTFKELLTHTSGFFRNKNYKKFKNNSSYLEVSHFLPQRWKRNVKNKHRYTNINYSALGASIEGITKYTFSDWVKSEFSEQPEEPTIYFTNQEVPDLLVKSYLQRYRRRYNHKPIKAGLWEPAALGATTPKDYAEYMRKRMTSDFIDLITSEKKFVKKRRLSNGLLYEEYYGLGFRLAYVNKQLSYIFHHGFVYGALSTFCYFPSYDIGYVALSNMSSFPKQKYPFARIMLTIVKKALNIDLSSPRLSAIELKDIPDIPKLFVN